LLIENKRSSSPDGILLSRLLEAENESGKTAFLIASQKDCALIELLGEAGTDVNAADQDGNGAILLAAYCPFQDVIPSKDSDIYRKYIICRLYLSEAPSMF